MKSILKILREKYKKSRKSGKIRESSIIKPDLRRKRLVSMLRSADDLDRGQLLELQEALTKKLAGFIDDDEQSKFFTIGGGGAKDEISLYMLQLLSNRVDFGPIETVSRSPRTINYSTTVSMDIALKGLTSWNFNAFIIAGNTRNRPLSNAAFWIFQNENCVKDLDLDEIKLASFLSRIENGYVNNAYHNNVHACDVLQKVYMMLNFGDYSGGDWSAEERFAAFFAAIIHDFKHPGVTNSYLMRTRDPLSVTYNDVSVLENFHIAEGFRILNQPENNFIHRFSSAQYFAFRKLVIEMVLATDMTHHFDVLAEWDKNFRPNGITKSPGTISNVSRVSSLKLMMKAADLGHCAVEGGLHRRWASNLQEEYFKQGDEERSRSMEISPLMNREKPGLLSSQKEFFDVVTLPLFHQICAAFPGSKVYLQNCCKNRNYWAGSGVDDVSEAGMKETSASAISILNRTMDEVQQNTMSSSLNFNVNKTCLNRKMVSFLYAMFFKNLTPDTEELKRIHRELRIHSKDFDRVLNMLQRAMRTQKFSVKEVTDAMSKIESMRHCFIRTST